MLLLLVLGQLPCWDICDVIDLVRLDIVVIVSVASIFMFRCAIRIAGGLYDEPWIAHSFVVLHRSWNGLSIH